MSRQPSDLDSGIGVMGAFVVGVVLHLAIIGIGYLVFIK